MKHAQDRRTVRVEFVLSERESERVRERMKECGVHNLSAFLRKMAVEGYIIHLDTSDVLELTKLLRICSNNLNQYARRANETGSIYASDIEDLRTRLNELWNMASKLLFSFANIP